MRPRTRSAPELDFSPSILPPPVMFPTSTPPALAPILPTLAPQSTPPPASVSPTEVSPPALSTSSSGSDAAARKDEKKVAAAATVKPEYIEKMAQYAKQIGSQPPPKPGASFNFSAPPPAAVQSAPAAAQPAAQQQATPVPTKAATTSPQPAVAVAKPPAQAAPAKAAPKPAQPAPAPATSLPKTAPAASAKTASATTTTPPPAAPKATKAAKTAKGKAAAAAGAKAKKASAARHDPRHRESDSEDEATTHNPHKKGLKAPATDIWNVPEEEERQRIREFWLSLKEPDRSIMIKLEKDTVLKKIKVLLDLQFLSCALSGQLPWLASTAVMNPNSAPNHTLHPFLISNPPSGSATSLLLLFRLWSASNCDRGRVRDALRRLL